MVVRFGVVHNLAGPLLVGTSSIVRFVNGIFPMERRIVPIPPHPVVIISEYTPLWALMSLLQTDLESEINTEDRQEKNNRTPQFRVLKHVAIRSIPKSLYQS